MNYANGVQTSFWIMIVLQTIGGVDMPGKGNRKMPAPRRYLAIILAWAVLQILTDVGQDRAANVIGWVLVLVALVGIPGQPNSGLAGRRLLEAFQVVTQTSQPTANPADATGQGLPGGTGQGIGGGYV